MRRAAAVSLAAVLAAAPIACDPPPEPRAGLSPADFLAADDTAGYDRADAPRTFSFPDDHGPHPGYRHEWWYFTGNLAGPDGERYGFQLTFFRSALRPGPASVESPWATSQVYMAHFAVTDVAGRAFRAFERFDRDALGLAGASASPLRVNVGEWTATAWPPDTTAAFPAIRLHAAEAGTAIDLVLEPTKPVVFQGDAGWSPKGPEPGNASYYYSLTRLAARGTVTVDGEAVRVAGLAWLDREWGTSALGPDLDGWDWFSAQLDDGSELMFFRLRRRDGRRDPLDSGTFVHADGRTTRLHSDDVVLQVRDTWRSPRGPVYPSGWTVAVPGLDLTLVIEPLLRDQELDLSFRYWEGAVGVRGQRGGRAVTGFGYVELTGYGDGQESRR